MFRKKYKVGFTDDLHSLINYINTSDSWVYVKDLIQFSADYDYFVTLYMNWNLISCLRDEHNRIISAQRNK